jgi:hypothetical protein
MSANGTKRLLVPWACCVDCGYLSLLSNCSSFCPPILCFVFFPCCSLHNVHLFLLLFFPWIIVNVYFDLLFQPKPFHFLHFLICQYVDRHTSNDVYVCQCCLSRVCESNSHGVEQNNNYPNQKKSITGT